MSPRARHKKATRKRLEDVGSVNIVLRIWRLIPIWANHPLFIRLRLLRKIHFACSTLINCRRRRRSHVKSCNVCLYTTRCCASSRPRRIKDSPPWVNANFSFLVIDIKPSQSADRARGNHKSSRFVIWLKQEGRPVNGHFSVEIASLFVNRWAWEPFDITHGLS